jgi:hypothetical protein
MVGFAATGGAAAGGALVEAGVVGEAGPQAASRLAPALTASIRSNVRRPMLFELPVVCISSIVPGSSAVSILTARVCLESELSLARGGTFEKKDSTMKQYLLSIYQPDGPTPPPEFLAKVMRDVNALTQELKDSGAWVFNGPLHPPSTATVLRAQNGGDMLITDGPYTEGKEHIGGFWIIKAADLDAALEWGRKAVRAVTLPIEVRPFQGEVEN